MRAFLAINVPDYGIGIILGVVDGLLKTDTPYLRPVNTDAAHLTLRFLGGISQSNIPMVADSISEVVKRYVPFNLSIGEPGAFPNFERPRVLWIGVGGDTGPLMRLQEDVEEAMSQLGFPRETKPFSPHLTVARIKDGISPNDRRRVAGTFRSGCSGGCFESIQIPVTEIHLVHSVLWPGGARYRCLAKISFENGTIELD